MPLPDELSLKIISSSMETEPISSSKSHFSSVLHNASGGADPGSCGGAGFILLSRNCHSLSLVSFSKDLKSRKKGKKIDWLNG